MFVSIIIPVYNAEKYLSECLDSCLKQDYPHQDYEIICVNDGSTDSSSDILAKYANQNDNIKVYIKENSGVSSARNTGLDAASGDYIWFVDADDVINSRSLLLLKKAIASTAADRLRFKGFAFSGDELSEQRAVATDDNVVWLSLFSNDLINQFRIRFHQEASYGEDTLFILEYMLHSKHQVDLDEGIYYLRIHAESATKKTSLTKKEEMVRSYFYVGSKMKELYEVKDQFPSTLQIFIADQMLMVMRKGLEVLAQLPSVQQKHLLKELKDKRLYPVKMPSECTYTWIECVNEPTGTGRMRNFYRYYSIYQWGLSAASLLYKLERARRIISNELHKNHMVTKILIYKNELFRKKKIFR